MAHNIYSEQTGEMESATRISESDHDRDDRGAVSNVVLGDGGRIGGAELGEIMIDDLKDVPDQAMKNAAQLMDLAQTVSQLRMGVDIATRVCQAQSKIVEIAVNELCALGQTEAIPVFFRKQILAALHKIREVEMPI